METIARLPLRRPERGRVVGGVAVGLATHLGVPLWLVRVVFVVLAPFGVGIALYVFWLVTIPTGDPSDASAALRPAALSRLARPPVDDGVPGAPQAPATGVSSMVARLRRLRWTEIIVGVALLLGAGALLAARNGLDVRSNWIVPVLLLLSGTALAWSQLDAVQRERRDPSAGRGTVSILRLVGGLVIAGVGVLLLVGQDAPPSALMQSTIAAVAVLAGVALVLAPWWLRLVRELGDERAARARESERADIAAHLHDSVLQTLALIRSRADDPVEVARMARAQERELRAWLYDERSEPGTSVAAILQAIVAEIEDSRTGPDGEAVTVETVVVGDREPDADTEALLQATREALVNAVRHGRPPFSLYLEVGPDEVEVFVRDRGDGFDIDAVPSDRFGVRESILGRVRRRGGRASVVCKDGGGTEVRLQVPVRPARPGEPTQAGDGSERTMQS